MIYKAIIVLLTVFYLFVSSISHMRLFKFKLTVNKIKDLILLIISATFQVLKTQVQLVATKIANIQHIYHVVK